MSRFLRTCSMTVLLLTFTGAVAAQPAPTPEESIAARRITIVNGVNRSVHYDVNGLSPLEAVAYRRLEYLENETERIGDEQILNRLRLQNATRVEQFRAPLLTLYGKAGTSGVSYAGAGIPYGATDSCTGSPQRMQTYSDLERAYLDVLNIERVRQVLPPLELAPPPAEGAGRAAASPSLPIPRETVQTDLVNRVKIPAARQLPPTVAHPDDLQNTIKAWMEPLNVGVRDIEQARLAMTEAMPRTADPRTENAVKIGANPAKMSKVSPEGMQTVDSQFSLVFAVAGAGLFGLVCLLRRPVHRIDF
jgi:hypothetical protein